MNTKRETLIDKIKNSNQLQCYLLIALPLIGFVVFSIYPMLWSASKAFFLL